MEFTDQSYAERQREKKITIDRTFYYMQCGRIKREKEKE